jgi:hypothetical protein
VRERYSQIGRRDVAGRSVPAILCAVWPAPQQLCDKGSRPSLLCLLPSVTTAWRGDFARHGAGTPASVSGKALPAATRQPSSGQDRKWRESASAGWCSCSLRVCAAVCLNLSHGRHHSTAARSAILISSMANPHNEQGGDVVDDLIDALRADVAAEVVRRAVPGAHYRDELAVVGFNADDTDGVRSKVYLTTEVRHPAVAGGHACSERCPFMTAHTLNSCCSAPNVTLGWCDGHTHSAGTPPTPHSPCDCRAAW